MLVGGGRRRLEEEEDRVPTSPETKMTQRAAMSPTRRVLDLGGDRYSAASHGSFAEGEAKNLRVNAGVWVR
jgi:hypothetical protein